jgi:hypothetical protein
MKLGSVSLKHPSNIKFLLNLKKLELADVNIDNDNLELMLSACNVLEFFGISGCKMLKSLHTPRHSNHLKGLKVSLCPLLQAIELNYGLITLEIYASSHWIFTLLSHTSSLNCPVLCLVLRS